MKFSKASKHFNCTCASIQIVNKIPKLSFKLLKYSSHHQQKIITFKKEVRSNVTIVIEEISLKGVTTKHALIQRYIFWVGWVISSVDHATSYTIGSFLSSFQFFKIFDLISVTFFLSFMCQN